jgi:hypothetical protein
MKETPSKEIWVQMEHKVDGQKSGGKIKNKGGEGNILDHIDPIPTPCLLSSPFPPTR